MATLWLNVVAAAALVGCLANPVNSLLVGLDRDECFLEDVKTNGDVVTGSFVVFDDEEHRWGGSLSGGVDLVVVAPAGYEVYSARHQSEGQFSFPTLRAGEYRFCFHNHAPRATSINFNIQIGHVEHSPGAAHDVHLLPVQEKVDRIREALWAILADQNYMRARAIRHMKTHLSTRKRVLGYAMLETVGLIGASVLQVYVLKRLFNKRFAYN